MPIDPSTNPFFIVGCPRSGTGLLRDLLRGHPNLSIPFESHFIPSFYRAYGHPLGARDARRLSRRILALPFVARWGLELPSTAFDDCRRFQDVVDTLFAAFADREGKPRWGDKTPAYARHLDLLSSLYPEARFVHVIRDPRDVTLSWLRSHYHPENTYTAATMWAQMVHKAREDGSGLGSGRYLEVRYDDLVVEPEAVLREVLEHLGEPFHSGVLTPNRLLMGRAGPDYGRRRPNWVARDRVTPESCRRWTSEMSMGNRALVESVAGRLLSDLAYPVEGLARRVGGAERLWWLLHHRVRYYFFRALGYPSGLADHVGVTVRLGKARVLAWLRPKAEVT